MTSTADPMTQVVEELLQSVITDFTGGVGDQDTRSFTCTDVSEFETFIWRQQDALASIGSYADFLYLIWMGTQSFEPAISESCARLHDVFTSQSQTGRLPDKVEAAGRGGRAPSQVAVTTRYRCQNSVPASSAVRSWLEAFRRLGHAHAMPKKRLFAVDACVENEPLKCLIWIGSPAQPRVTGFNAVQVKQRRHDFPDPILHWPQQAMHPGKRRYLPGDPAGGIASKAYFSCSALLWSSSNACVIEAAAAVEPYFTAALRRSRRAVDVYLGLIDPPFYHVGESAGKAAASDEAEDDADELSSGRGLDGFLGREDRGES